MKKRLVSWLLTIAMILMLLPGAVFATDNKCGDNLTWTLENGVLTISGTGAMENYEDTGAPWYDAGRGVTEIKVESGVTIVGDYAFHTVKCATIHLPETLTSIGKYAFSNCRRLMKIQLPETVVSVGEYAFSGCDELTEINIPASVTQIGTDAFKDCQKLLSVTYGGTEEMWAKVSGTEALRGKSIKYTDPVVNPDPVNPDPVDPDPVDPDPVDPTDPVKPNPGQPEEPETSGTPTHTHTWDDGTVVKKATCTKAGTKKYSCTGCTETKTEEYRLATTEHRHIPQRTEPTCTAPGEIRMVCEYCGDDYQDRVLPAKEHEKVYTVTQEKTCTLDKITVITCKNCDYKQTVVEKATGHHDIKKVTDPTCTQEGYTTHYCVNCKRFYRDEETAKVPHTYRKVVTKPTCTQQGYTTYTCVGNPECHDSYASDYVPATGHSWNRSKITTQPTCQQTGIRTYYCANCSAEKTETVAALGHSYDKVTVTRTATVLQEGETTYACSHENCGAFYTEPIARRSNPFTDVPVTEYYLDSVMWAVDNGITVGMTPTTFEPETECTRAHVVTFLWRAAGRPSPSQRTNPFVDVKEKDYFYDAVLWAVENGITMGATSTTFEPDSPCTRAQVVTFLWRTAGKTSPAGDKSTFRDVPQWQYFYKPVLWAVENSITQGTGGGKFSPEDVCTRAQVVTFLYRFYG